MAPPTLLVVKREQMRGTRRDIAAAAQEGLDWLGFAGRVNDAVNRVVPFDRACWHAVDPGTYLFTGLLGHNMVCSGPWLAEHEYVLDDVNKWVDLARSGQLAGALSEATGGKLTASARVRSSIELGMPLGDELRASFVTDGSYWAAAGFLRDEGPSFDSTEVGFVAAASSAIAEGFRRAVLVSTVPEHAGDDNAPGVIVLDGRGRVESISPQAQRWIGEIVEEPPPRLAHEARVIQAVAARARHPDAAGSPARARTQTRSGQWLLLYGTTLAGELAGRVAVIVQPAGPHDIAPLVAQAYGLSSRERDVARLCLRGLTTKEIAAALHISPYTVQDHLKSIFDKTGARSRAELVGQVFLEHYIPRLEDVGRLPSGWNAQAIDPPHHGS
jgi:DNA-binding CsgD family transcriptional regulator